VNESQSTNRSGHREVLRGVATTTAVVVIGLCVWSVLKGSAASPVDLSSLKAAVSTHKAVREQQPKTGTSIPSRLPPDEGPEADQSDEAAGRGEWLYRIRAFPHRHIPRGARMRAFEQVRRMRVAIEATGALSSDSAQHWTLVGPQPTFDGYSGRVTSIVVDPKNSNTIFLGGAEGGVWKSTDGGVVWKPLTDSQPALGIGSLAIDPSNSDVIYAGTGEQNFNYDAYSGVGVLKTTDGGSTWTVLGSDVFDQQGIGALAIQPGHPEVILAAADAGVYWSGDGGASWQYVLSGPATDVVFDPTTGSAYAAVGGPFEIPYAGVYKSVDGGVTWKASNGSAAKALPSSSKIGRIALAISPSSHNTIFAGVSDPNNASPLGLYKSTDGAGSWTRTGSSAYCGGQCWYNNVLAVNPANSKMMIGGGVSLMFSADGGATWSFAGRDLHVDQHAVAFTHDGSRVFVGNDGGVWASSAKNTSFEWLNLNSTLALTQFYAGLSIHPSDPAISFGGTQDNQSLAFSGSLKWRSVTCGDGAATAIDPIHPANVYITCAGLQPGGHFFVIQKSATGGGAGTYVEADNGLSAAEGVPFVPYITIDPTDPQNLYFTGNQHIYQTTNGGGSWKAISPDVTSGFLWPCAIAVAPSDSNTVYSGSCDGVVKVTHKALSGSASAWRDISAGLPGNAVTHISVDPGSPMKAYATMSGFQAGHVFLTQDGGNNWTDISGNLPDLPANDLVIDPDLAGTLYLATDMGVFWTNDTGKVWSPFGAGLPNAAVLSLAFQEASRTLRAATHGRSVWDLLVPVQGLNLIPAVSSISPSQISLEGSQILTVNGQNFSSGSVVYWNGQPLPTTFVSSTQITASLTGSDAGADGLVAVSVVTPEPGGGASLPQYVKVGPNPAIYPGAFLNAASFLPGTGVAPGSIVSVFGANLASADATLEGIPLSPNLGGSSLGVSDLVSGFTGLAPLFFVSPGQINFQVPWEAVPFQSSVFTPLSGGAEGAGVTVNIAFFAPGIFTVNQSGSGQGTVTNAVTGQLAAPVGKYANSQPVKRGDYISIYCTGLGLVDSPPADGAAAPGKPLAKTLVTPVVMIGAVPATASFSGLAPGFVGLNQVNVQVPTNAPTGDAVPLSISDGQGDNSNVVTIAIR
jgi:uncharacterized protein (TIGR03437 family)